MSEMNTTYTAVEANVSLAEKALKNARVLAETAFGMAKFNLESVQTELRCAEARLNVYGEYTPKSEIGKQLKQEAKECIANTKERVRIAERELEAAKT